VQDRRAELAEAVSNALQDLFDLLQQSSRLTWRGSFGQLSWP